MYTLYRSNLTGRFAKTINRINIDNHMGKVISLINTTPDGFADSQYVNADAEFHEFVHGLLAETDTVAFGRNSFELFQQIWPAVLEKEGAPESQVRMAK